MMDFMRGIANYVATDEGQLRFILYILKMVESGWWYGIDDSDNDEWLPSSQVEILDEEPLDDKVYNYGDNYAVNLSLFQ